MSNQETINYKETICREIQSYKGFTSSEKEFGMENVKELVDESGNLDGLINKFEEISLDIRPFISERELARA